MKIEKSERLFSLYNIYGNLLTDTQQAILDMFLKFDNTLVEIGEELNVTRQSVFNAIKVCEKLLEEYEQKLGISDWRKKIVKELIEIKNAKCVNKNSKIVEKIDKIIKNM